MIINPSPILEADFTDNGLRIVSKNGGHRAGRDKIRGKEINTVATIPKRRQGRRAKERTSMRESERVAAAIPLPTVRPRTPRPPPTRLLSLKRE